MLIKTPKQICLELIKKFAEYSLPQSEQLIKKYSVRSIAQLIL
jgi:hypothetical protein